MDTDKIRKQLSSVVLARLSDSPDRRREALGEFMGVTMPGVEGKAAETVSSLVPEIPFQIYEKWVNMFIDRLFETVPLDQLEELTNGTEDNNAAIALVYVMFMESQRMEQQVVSDLAQLGMEQALQDDVGNTLADYLRAKLANMKNGAPTQ